MYPIKATRPAVSTVSPSKVSGEMAKQSLYERLDIIVARSSAFVAIAGGLGLLLAIGVTCLSIALKLTRRLLDATLGSLFNSDAWAFIRPILGEEELVQYGVGLALFAALPWVMYARGHVRIDLFKGAFGRRFNRALDLAGDVVFATLAYLILTRQWFQIFRPARRKEEPLTDLLFSSDPMRIFERLRSADESQILGVKIWPLYSIAEICVLMFFIVSLFAIWRSSRALMAPEATSFDH